MKKILSLFIALLLLLTSLAVPTATAADVAILHSEDTAARPDTLVTVPLYLSNAAALVSLADGSIGGIQIEFQYDSDQLIVGDFAPADAIKNFTCDVSVDGNRTKLLAYNGSVSQPYGLMLDEYMTGDLLLGELTLLTYEAFTAADVHIEIQKICDSCQNETGYAISYDDAITAVDFTLANYATLHAGAVEAVPDSIVEVPLYLENAAALVNLADGSIGGVQFVLEYDHTKMELGDFVAAGAFEELQCDYSTLADGKNKIMAYNASTAKPYGVMLDETMTDDLLIGYMVFVVKEDFADSPVEITIQNICDSCQNDTGVAMSYNAALLAKSFTIGLKRVVSGDMDETGVIDVADIMLLKGLIMQEVWSDLQLDVGDFDGSGRLDVADIMSIKAIVMRG